MIGRIVPRILAEPSMDHLTRDHVIWAYRLLLDRDPENEDAITPKLRAWRTPRELRTDIMSSAEFRRKNPDVAQTATSTTVIKQLAGGARLFIDLADHVIGLPVLRDQYEVDELRFAQSLLQAGDTAIDVGAHIGFFTIHMAQAVGSTGIVYAFEPLERNAALLEQSIRENRFDDRVRLERAAVSHTSGTSLLHFAEETLNTGGAFLGATRPNELGELASVEVRTVRLDDVPWPKRVRLIKMDVEGAEPAVVQGARALLRAHRPVVISEVHPEQLARVSHANAASAFADFAELGYRAHRIDARGVGPRVGPAEITGVTTLAFMPT